MGLMHAPGKGLSQLALLYHCSFPTWLKLMSDDVKHAIYKLAKMCLTPSQIDECSFSVCLPVKVVVRLLPH
uniref:Small ribosomal subunit protein uS15 N-terminal domain-containing protein n=1 Tax=Canis lupus familiaris TaxID=9615 RepID=A0A8P0TC58_CANLF